MEGGGQRGVEGRGASERGGGQVENSCGEDFSLLFFFLFQSRAVWGHFERNPNSAFIPPLFSVSFHEREGLGRRISND